MNGERVLDITGEYLKTTGIIYNRYWLSNNIKLLATREQFSSIEYKVEGLAMTEKETRNLIKEKIDLSNKLAYGVVKNKFLDVDITQMIPEDLDFDNII